MNSAKKKTAAAETEKKTERQEQATKESAAIRKELKKSDKKEKSRNKKEARQAEKLSRAGLKEKQEKERVQLKALRDQHKANERARQRAIRDNWYRLDNSALIFPAIKSSRWNNVYRISVMLKKEIDPKTLQSAVNETLKRFSLFNVSLRPGLFWYYFQSLEDYPKVMQESEYPCRPFEFKRDSHIFRILYFKNRIAFESFHSLTDGFGALKFMNTLIVCYLELSGIIIKDKEQFGLNYLDNPKPEESEDAFKRHADLKKINARTENMAFQVKGTIKSPNVLNVITGVLHLGKIKELSKKYDATINDFILAVYMQALIHEHTYFKGDKRPTKISVPVNLRRFFPSETLRNFLTVSNLQVDADERTLTIEEILARIKEKHALLTPENLMGNINVNVKIEKNFFVRMMPLIIKNPIMNLVYSKVGENQFTSTFSNLGAIAMPEDVAAHVERYDSIIGPTKVNNINLTAMGYLDKLSLTFSSRIEETRIQQKFFKSLTDMGLEVNVESNF